MRLHNNWPNILDRRPKRSKHPQYKPHLNWHLRNTSPKTTAHDLVMYRPNNQTVPCVPGVHCVVEPHWARQTETTNSCPNQTFGYASLISSMIGPPRGVSVLLRELGRDLWRVWHREAIDWACKTRPRSIVPILRPTNLLAMLLSWWCWLFPGTSPRWSSRYCCYC